MLFFHFLRKTSQLLPERNAGKLPHYYYFSNVGLEPVHKKNTRTLTMNMQSYNISFTETICKTNCRVVSDKLQGLKLFFSGL